MSSNETMVKVYTNPKNYAKDAKDLAKDGWKAENVTERQPRRGCGRILAMGVIFAFIFPPKPELVVTYSRERLNKGYVRCWSCGTINQAKQKRFFCTKCGSQMER